MKVSKLKRNPNNPREIKDEKFDKLKRSISEFPQMMSLRPIIIDADNVVLGGNMRLAAIKALGMKDIPDEWVMRADELTDEQKREFIIKDNAGFGAWNWDTLANEWDEAKLIDWGLDIPGFEVIEDAPQEDEEAAAEAINKAAELQKKWGTATGQLWKLGEHRLICGDCTDNATVERLMQGEKANLCLTDPPYGLGARKESGKNDYATYEDSKQNLAVLAAKWLPIAREISSAVVFSPGVTNAWLYPEADWVMCWFYGGGQLRSSWGFNCWQPFLCYGKDPSLATGHGGRPDAVDMNTPANAGDIDHPCPKPMKLWEWFIGRLSFQAGESIYDPFLGSGTTLIACEQLNRKCYAIEIAPEYVAVALERWHNLTNQTPELIEQAEAAVS